MLVIREAQLTALEDDAVHRYVDELAAHCRTFSPHLCKTLSDEELHAAVLGGVVRAETQGFTKRGPVRLYVDMMILLGSGFDGDPQYPWAAAILATPDEQMDRAETLHARVHEYLAGVDGPDNVHTLQALRELATRCRQGLALHRERLEPDLLALMAEIHPRKVAATGEDALRRLVRALLARGRERYRFRTARSLALMAVLGFAFGHDFDADPLLPWVSRTLNRPTLGDPDAVAVRLERRALIWLDAVLRNVEADRS